MKNIRLTVELIPASNFYNNIRSTVKKKQWDIMRKDCYEKANHKCEICGETGIQQGYKHPVEAHEVWCYNLKTKVQKLERLICLCVRCHLCKHIGRAFAVGKQAEVFAHLEKINSWNHKELVTYLVKCFQDHKKKSSVVWSLDLSFLTTEYGINKMVLAKAKKTKAPKNFYWKKKKGKK